jgi:hypothetical protein
MCAITKGYIEPHTNPLLRQGKYCGMGKRDGDKEGDAPRYFYPPFKHKSLSDNKQIISMMWAETLAEGGSDRKTTCSWNCTWTYSHTPLHIFLRHFSIPAPLFPSAYILQPSLFASMPKSKHDGNKPTFPALCSALRGPSP